MRGFNILKMRNKKLIDNLQILLMIILILFGLFISYQIIRKIVGASWETESIIIALLMLNIGLTFTIAISQVKLNSDHNHLQRQFQYLAKDFKEQMSLK